MVNHQLRQVEIIVYMIGDRLRELREDAGLNQPEFAAIAGTSKQYVGRLEKGFNKSPRPDLVEKWARHFRVRMEWITTGKLPKSATESQPAGLDLEMLKSAIVAVKESLRKAELVFDTYEAAPIIAYAYQERIKLPRDLPKAKLREFDQQVWKHLQGELAHDTGQGRTLERGSKGAEIAAPAAKKVGRRKA